MRLRGKPLEGKALEVSREFTREINALKEKTTAIHVGFANVYRKQISEEEKEAEMERLRAELEVIKIQIAELECMREKAVKEAKNGI